MTTTKYNGKHYYRKLRTTNNYQNPTKELQKICLTSLIPETNTHQKEPIIHFTNTLITITNKTIPQTTISVKYNHGSGGVQKH